MDATNTVFSLFSFVGFVLCFVPLYWHLEAWNVGTCSYMIWAGLGCLMYFINSVVWAGNVINWAPVWCDISSRFIIGITVAIPAASLCINRRLYHIANPTSATMKTKKEKRRDIMIDLSFCLGIPVVQMLLQLVVEGHRFNIFEDIGCYPATYNTTLAYPLVLIWPIVIGLASAVYCVLTLHAFFQRRKGFKDLLRNNSNLTFSRYFRLMGLAGVELLCSIPLCSFLIYLNVAADPNGVQPWISWADTHADYGVVLQIPKELYGADHLTLSSLELSRWLMVICAIVFFGFFGFADEAKKHYRIAYVSIAKKVGVTTVSSTLTSATSSTFPSKFRNISVVDPRSNIPVYVTKETDISRDSISSFSDKLSTSFYIGETTTTDDRVQSWSPSEAPSSPLSPAPPSPMSDTTLAVPERVHDSSSIRRPSVPDAPMSVQPDSGLDIV